MKVPIWKVANMVIININGKPGKVKKYIESKEIERHLPGYYSWTSLECTDDDEKE